MHSTPREIKPVVPGNDSRLIVNDIVYSSETGRVRAHFARPKGDRKLAGVVVIHENRGLVPHIKDVARRVALEGFQAIAPDALSPIGGTPEDITDVPTLIQKLDREATIRNGLQQTRGQPFLHFVSLPK